MKSDYPGPESPLKSREPISGNPNRKLITFEQESDQQMKQGRPANPTPPRRIPTSEIT